MRQDPFEILGVSHSASLEEIKTAYRHLAKKHHPDRGGEQEKILAINAAWEAIRNIKTLEKNKDKDPNISNHCSSNNNQNKDKEMESWLKIVYYPIDRLMAEIINPLTKNIKELSADPYDDQLMDNFCEYIEKSQKKINKARDIYQSIPTPIHIREFSLSLYQCFSEIQDGINELERYSAGYVESYLHDGNEMIRQAKKNRILLHQTKKQLTVN